MLERQGGWCCFKDYDFCPGRLRESDASFEHEHKRGAGKHDSRIVDGNGQPQNGAAHKTCNLIAGSRRFTIWHGPEISCCDVKMTPESANAFGKHNYLINISVEKNGIGYKPKWTHLDGFSESVLDYIVAAESYQQ